MDFKEFVRDQVRKYYWVTPSACALKWYHAGGEGRFVELRAEAEQTIQIFKQSYKPA